MPYQVSQEIKADPQKRWELSDKVFFSCGACHILAQAYLDTFHNEGFQAEWIRPKESFIGNHVYVTNGELVFDWHGYSDKEQFLAHYFRKWRQVHEGWDADVVPVTTNLYSSTENLSIGMNARGTDRYLHNPVPRAQAYLKKFSYRHVQLHRKPIDLTQLSIGESY